MTFQSIKDIQRIIDELVNRKIEAGQVVNMHWATTEVINTYPDIKGQDVDFYVVTARHYVGEMVKRCINKFEPQTNEAGEQLVLDGFNHLQKAYPFEGPNGREIVPTEMAADLALLQRAEEYERMAEGMIAHAAEIRDYVRNRRADYAGLSDAEMLAKAEELEAQALAIRQGIA